jgi:cyclase
VGEASRRVGNQSVVVVLDVRRESASGAYRVFTHNGTKASGLDAVEAASRVARLGAGEVVVNSIDRDGSLDGYDLDLMASVRKAVGVPLTALGGAGSIEHMEALLRRIGIAGAAAGSLFVFKGVYRAVLINYPNRRAKDALCREPAGAVG